MTSRREGRGKGRRQGGAMMAWLFFANLFEPKKAAAMEHVDTQRRIGPDAGQARSAAAAPPAGGGEGSRP